jgi:steroid delta-isomerase-like uncharacterized protein
MSTDKRTLIVRDIFERTWNRADFAGIEDVLGETCIFHFRRSTREMDIKDFKRIVGAWHSAFPDMHFVVEDLVTGGDTVSIRLIHRGTHLGTWKGIAATGKSFEVDVMCFLRFDEGRIVEIWEVADEYAMWEQLGVSA